ncbi:DUF6783 domain-containing protein [Fusicatenibacter saccharivorans]|uniref:DUF6783 domain-containing protein n=1 Tax=Fusicatenibacter saccharivorans TaxID=1150298 RepID=UPI0035656ECD
MKKAFRELRVPFSAQTVCSNRIRSKQIAKWGLQIVEMIFQILFLFYHPNRDCTMQIWFVFYSVFLFIHRCHGKLFVCGLNLIVLKPDTVNFL